VEVTKVETVLSDLENHIKKRESFRGLSLFIQFYIMIGDNFK